MGGFVGNLGAHWWIVLLIAVVVLAVISGVVIAVAARSRSARRVSPVMHEPIEDRLAELDDLHQRGVIDDDEHRTARADALRHS